MAISKPSFRASFEKAARLCLEFARTIVSTPLPESIRFNIRSRLVPFKESGRGKFLGGRLINPEELRLLDLRRVVDLLWVDGKVPHWVNLSVHGADGAHTFIDVAHADLLTGDPERLMHKSEGTPPFHVLSPPVPESWVPGSPRFRLQEGGRFVSLSGVPVSGL